MARVQRGGRDLVFRWSTGSFAFLLVLIVVAGAVVLWRESLLSIRAFGLDFWVTETWDPVLGEFGALPFIWGTLYSSILAVLIATPVALGIAVFLTEICPHGLRTPLVARVGAGHAHVQRAAGGRQSPGGQSRAGRHGGALHVVGGA